MLRALLSATLLCACGGAPQTTTTPTKTTATPNQKPVVGAAPVEEKPKEFAYTAEAIVANVDGKPIRLAEVDRHLTDQAKTPDNRWRALDDLIGEKVIINAADREMVVVTDDEVDQALTEIQKSNNLDRKALEKLLAEQGFTFDSYRNELRDQIKRLRYVAAHAPKDPKKRDAKVQEIIAELRKRDHVEVLMPNPGGFAKQGTPIKAQKALITTDEVAKTLGKKLPTYEEGPLGNEPDTTIYRSHHWRATGLREANDFAYRVWTPGTLADAKKQFADLVTNLGTVVEHTKLATRSFTATEPGIVGIGFIDETKSTVVLVTCGTDICTNEVEAIALTKLLVPRI